MVDKDYLSQIDGHLDEKSGYWLKCISNGNKQTFLDIGPGGCGLIKDLMLKRPRLEIHSIDSSMEIASEAAKLIGTNSACSDFFENTYPSDHFDYVNCSSVVHEVFSYSGGHAGIGRFFEGVLRIMRPGGICFYRDVLAPTNRNYKRVSYDSVPIRFFLDLFLPFFLDSCKESYGYCARTSQNGIWTTTFLHREIQKHYILCLKDLHPDAASLDDASRRMEDMVARDPTLAAERIQRWLSREGRESYVYYSVEELTDVLGQIHNDNFGFEVVDKFVQIRQKDCDFLSSTFLCPEIEGKQVVVIKKISG